jgi:hypothetical protein
MIDLIKSGLVGVLVIVVAIAVSTLIATYPAIFGIILIAGVLVGLGTLVRMIIELW